MPGVLSRMPGVLYRLPRVSADSGWLSMPGVLELVPGRVGRLRAAAYAWVLSRMPGVLYRLPRASADSGSRHMPRRIAVGRDRAACPAQHGIAVDRFAREIVCILKACSGALAATECQTVRHPWRSKQHAFS